MDESRQGEIAIIFVSQRAAADPEGYERAAEAMCAAAAQRPGYRGIRSARGTDGIGITISYWQEEQSALAWRDDPAHAAVREEGRRTWYDWYETIVTEVVRDYAWARP